MYETENRNQFGILLAWGFVLAEESLAGIIIMLILDLWLLKELKLKKYHKTFIVSLLLFILNKILFIFINLTFSDLFILLISFNMTLFFTYIYLEGIKEALTWYALTFFFYCSALFFPETIMLNDARIRCFSLVRLIFMPYALLYTCNLYLVDDMQKLNSHMLK